MEPAHLLAGVPRAGEVHMSAHAMERMASLGFSAQEVRKVVDSPLASWPGSWEHPQGRRVLEGPDMLVVFCPATRTVITVKLRTKLTYVHGVHDRHHLPACPKNAA